jgi:hypothetical protein
MQFDRFNLIYLLQCYCIIQFFFKGNVLENKRLSNKDLIWKLRSFLELGDLQSVDTKKWTNCKCLLGKLPKTIQYLGNAFPKPFQYLCGAYSKPFPHLCTIPSKLITISVQIIKKLLQYPCRLPK